MFTISLDLGNIESLFGKITTFARRAAPRIASDILIAEIVRKTSEGRHADNSSFSDYSASQRRKRKAEGLQVAKKDLTFTGGMMGSLHFERSRSANKVFITVGQQFQEIAHGQMFHPAWKPESHSKFLLVDDDSMPKVESELISHFERLR